MCGKASIYQASGRSSSDSVSKINSIGELFRDYGQQYIQAYHPPLPQIKLINAISVCKTPAMGGHCITCKDCGQHHYIYHSCGHSHCMLCQSIKREQWVDKLKASLLAVPYVHMTFTLPHQLNMLAKWNKSLLYHLILKISWNTVHTIGKDIGATFGSDMKYHIHVHALVTFGGLNENGEWIYPPTKNKISKYRKICALYKDLFLAALNNEFERNNIHYPQNFEDLLTQVSKTRWVVHSTYPTMDTNLIENYLGKYINRVAITNNRLTYIKDNQSVILMYNDYAQQVSGQAAPKALKQMDPLSAIHQIMQHVLPPYFQKSRKYGLHHPSSKMMTNIPQAFRRNNQTIRSLFEIITHLMKLHPFECQHCHSKNYVITIFDPVRNHPTLKVSASSLKSPPNNIAPATSNIPAISPVNAGTSVSAI